MESLEYMEESFEYMESTEYREFLEYMESPEYKEYNESIPQESRLCIELSFISNILASPLVCIKKILT